MSHTPFSEFMHPDVQRVTRYSFQPLSTGLITSLVDQVLLHESAVLLGAPGIGKQFVFPRLEESLRRKNDIYRFCHVKCDDLDNHREGTLVTAILSELRTTYSERNWDSASTLIELREKLLSCLREVRSKLVFTVANIDLLPEFLARTLLQHLREYSHLGRDYLSDVTVLLTGSSDLMPLVFGANSEFHVRSQVVVHGYDQDLFKEQVGRLSRVCGLNIDEQAQEFLFVETGGHHNLLRAATDSLINRRRSRQLETCEPVTLSELENVLAYMKRSPSVSWDFVTASIVRLESSADSLRLLRQLIEHGCCRIPSPATTSAIDPPTQLELYGVARRQEGQLRWASPLMQSVCERYFNGWTLGDAFACCNDWDTAFDCYSMAARTGIFWSASGNDRPRLSSAIRSFESRIFNISGQPTDAADDVRTACLQFLPFFFGFHQTVWCHVDTRKESWHVYAQAFSQTVASDDSNCDRSFLSRLPAPAKLRDLQELRSGGAIIEVVVPLPGFDGSNPECLLMSNYHTQLPITGETRANVLSVARAIQLAYKAARQNEHILRQSLYRQQLLEALPGMMGGFGGSDARLKRALETAGDTLRNNGYRRVMFSMVDLKKRTIEGVVDCRAPAEVDISELTAYSLDVPEGVDGQPAYVDIQQKVVLERRRVVIPDASTHPLINKDVLDQTGLGGLAIFPLMLKGEVLGTMHVERSDRKPLDSEQIEALQYFADQVTNAVDAIAWVDMLEASTLEEPESVVLVDEHWRVRYVNRSASVLFVQEGIAAGWQDPSSPLMAVNYLPVEVYDVAQQALKADSTISRYVSMSHDQHKMAVNVIPLRAWRKSSTGFLIQIRDLKSWHHLLAAFSLFAKAGDFDELGLAVLNSVRQMGHAWARFYLYDEESGRLVGRRHVGHPTELEDPARFQPVVLPSREQPGSTWMCLDRRSPVVLQHLAYDRRSDREFRTEKGIEVFATLDEFCPEKTRKAPGEMWIDFPLLHNNAIDQPIGKISVSCDPTLTLVEFEELRLLMEAVQTAFTVVALRKQKEFSLSVRLRQMMLKAIGETCHHLRSKLAALVTFSERYRDVTDAEEIEQLNRLWLKRMKDLEGVLDEAADGLRPVKAKRERRCLSRFLRETFDEAAGPGHFRFFCKHDSENGLPEDFPADFDADLLKKAFAELVQNSRKASKAKPALHMEVELSGVSQLGVSFCRIDVRDQGCGIRKENLQEVFEDFFSEWKDAETRGTGLGLSLVQSIIAVHRGRISALECQTGAWFRIEFPRFENTISRVSGRVTKNPLGAGQ